MTIKRIDLPYLEITRFKFGDLPKDGRRSLTCAGKNIICGQLHTGSSACICDALDNSDSPTDRLNAASTDQHRHELDFHDTAPLLS